MKHGLRIRIAFVVLPLTAAGLLALPPVDAGKKTVLTLNVEVNKFEQSKKGEVVKIVITSKAAGITNGVFKADKKAKFTYLDEDGKATTLTASTVLTGATAKDAFKDGMRARVTLPAGTGTFTEIQFGPGLAKKKK